MKKNDKVYSGSELYYFRNKVVTRNIITDFVQSIRNLLGLELVSYSNIIDTTIKELTKDAPPLKWFRVDIENISGGILVSIYGERK